MSTDAATARPGRSRWLTGRNLSSWPRGAACLAPIWSLAYGLLALSWALGATGYPFSEAVDPDAGLSLLGSVAPGVGAAGLATLSLLGAVVGAAMLRGCGHGHGRRLAMGLGGVMAVTFAVLLPDLRLLAVMAYTPILLVGAPFGWPPGVSLASAFTWPLVHQVVVMTGGILWAGATIRYRRRTAGACERCGRAPGALGVQEVAWAARWDRRAVAVAVVIPLLYSVTRWAWVLGIPLGLPVDVLRSMDGNEWVAGAMLANVAALGALLTIGLVLRWGEVVPGWMPIIGARRIPLGLAILPASLMTIVITSAGLAFVRAVLVGEVRFRMEEWGAVGPTLLWPAWGAALGVATLAYSDRRRGTCRACGRGTSERAGRPCKLPQEHREVTAMTIKALATNHPVLSYYALAFAISWGAILIAVGPGRFLGTTSTSPSFALVGFVSLLGPGIAGVLMTALVAGRPGLRELLSRLLRWRVGLRWYAVALLTAPLVTILTLLALSLTSRAFVPAIITAEDKASLVLSGIAVGLIVPIFEELGWTGFVTPRLWLRHGVLGTGLIMGLLWGAWHLPIFAGSAAASGGIPPALFMAAMLFSWLPPYRVLIVWVHDRTQSLLLVMLMHMPIVVSQFVLNPEGLSGEQMFASLIATGAALWLVVGVVALANGGHITRDRGVGVAPTPRTNHHVRPTMDAPGAS